MDDNGLNALGQMVVGALPGAVIGHQVAFGELTVTIYAEKVVEVARELVDGLIGRGECEFVRDFAEINGFIAFENIQLGK